jgi:hypothetical protein
MTLIIPGESLVLHKQYLGELANILDPDGNNVIDTHMLHNDTAYVRLFGMFKILNSYEPFEAFITLPLDIFNRISREVDEEEINATYETIH